MDALPTCPTPPRPALPCRSQLRRLMDVSLGPEEFRKALGRLEVKTDKVRGQRCCEWVKGVG